MVSRTVYRRGSMEEDVNDSFVRLQMQFMLLFSRQGKLRLQKWYVAHPDKLKKKITRELITTILARKPKMSSFLEWKDVKVVYKRYITLTRERHALRSKDNFVSHNISDSPRIFTFIKFCDFRLQIRELILLLRN